MDALSWTLIGAFVLLGVVPCFVLPYGAHPADYTPMTTKVLR